MSKIKHVGTPKNLAGAIQIGLANAHAVTMGNDEAEDLAKEVLPHVKDFLAQRFSVAMLEAPEPTQKLWESIFGKRRLG